jgi:hypothetical protein
MNTFVEIVLEAERESVKEFMREEALRAAMRAAAQASLAQKTRASRTMELPVGDPRCVRWDAPGQRRSLSGPRNRRLCPSPISFNQSHRCAQPFRTGPELPHQT